MRERSGVFRLVVPVDLAATAVVLAGMGVLVFGTSPASAQKKSADKVRQSTYAAIAEVPEKAREKRNPVEGDAQAVAVGRKLFEQH